ncbi:MAG: TerB N-terminal domain-containing protein [Anaerolineae bacterium]|nr:TerB N-terminal domain-containing protein [Anaerolineae bacterium]
MDRPAGFQIHWQFDRTRQVLNRAILGADGYLGEGWFYRGKGVWKLQESITPTMLQWLDKTTIRENELYKFVTQVFPLFQQLGHICDLTVEPDLRLDVQVIKVLKRSADFQITSNKPALQKQLKTIRDDASNLISGDTILPGLAIKLRGKLLQLAKSGEVTRISGDELLAFLQDDLTSVASESGVDIESLRTAFPIDDAALVPATWKLEHDIKDGIGRYEIVPCVQASGELIPTATLEKAFQSGSRFLKVGERWLEFTPQFSVRYQEWRQKNLRKVRLAPQEVMGSYTDRLDRLQLVPPHIETEKAPTPETEGEKARILMQTMRYHGLPVGIYGLQEEMPAIIADVCLQLLEENPRASIVWLAPGRKKDDIVRVLRHSRVPYNKFHSEQGQVLLISPEMLATLNREWTLVIFSDLDIIASGDKQARALASIKREWSISTFNRADWHQNGNRAGRVLGVLGFDARDLSTFVRVCTATYSDQSQSLLSRLTSPFRTVTVQSDDSNNRSGDVPIPPRRRSIELHPIQNTDNVFRPSFTVTVDLSTPRSRFPDQARELENHIEPPTESVSFMQYWPTYESMNNAQRKWYFYWRSQVRDGQYLPTDLSYLYLHVYEVIQLIGVSNADSGANYLANLWRQYRIMQPGLDNYLVDWIADFHAVYKLSRTPLDWYASVLDTNVRLFDRNLAVEAWVSQKDDIQAIPDNVLVHVSDYQPAKSKFIQQHNEDNWIDRALRDGLSRIDQFLIEQNGKSLFDQYRPEGKTIVRRQPFASAVYEGKRDEVVIATVPNWSDSTELRSSITSILKYTENLLRRQHGFRGTLRGIELPPEWQVILDAAFGVPDVGKTGAMSVEVAVAVAPIVIDFAKVKELAAESDEVRDRLLVDDEETGVEVTDIAPPPDTVEPPEVVDTFNLERPDDTPDGLLTDLEEVYTIIQGDLEASELLRYLMQNDWQAHPDTAASVLNGGFLNVVLDRMNELALEQLGDQIVVEEDGLLVVIDDYRDEIGHLLSQPLEQAKSPAEAVPAYADLTPEWAAFVNKMKPQHWEALHALLLQEDVVARLDGIARSTFTTMDLLIDEINDVALSNLGDIVIETGETPAIEEEDMDDLRSLMAWAQENILQEI